MSNYRPKFRLLSKDPSIDFPQKLQFGLQGPRTERKIAGASRNCVKREKKNKGKRRKREKINGGRKEEEINGEMNKKKNE